MAFEEWLKGHWYHVSSDTLCPEYMAPSIMTSDSKLWWCTTHEEYVEYLP